jgi:4-amino-4-deoxy-L-arabinose transferase-like glycosyltransferase
VAERKKQFQTKSREPVEANHPSETSGQAVPGIVLELFAPTEENKERKRGLRRLAPLLFLIGITVICLLPFIGKAFNIDDPLFLWAAKNIQSNPSNPYGFNVNWYGFDMRMSEVTKNPPITSYYIAAIGSVFGWSEVALHLAFLLPAIGVVVGTYLIAGHFCKRPLVAALCSLLTPVFLVSSTSVMSDTMMLAFWVFAVYFWISGVERNSTVRLLLSSVFIPLCALTKYFGITLVPLLLLYSLVKERRLGMWALYLLISVAILAWYQWATHALYGRGLLLDAASYATEASSQFGKWSIPKVLVGLAFTGGCVAVVFFFTRLLWSTKAILGGAIATVILAFLISSSKSIGAYSLPADSSTQWTIAIELSLFAICGISLLAVAVLDLVRHKNAESILLFAWIVGTFIFAAFVNWTTNGRSILPMVPAAGILIVRRMELGGKVRKYAGLKQLSAPLVGAAILSLAVTWGDTATADSARRAARLINGRYSTKTNNVWFQGHWGFQYYMELAGGRAIDVNKSRFAPNDIVVVPTNNTNLFAMPPEWSKLSSTIEVQSSGWITTMHTQLGAGFYADVWGPLPFAVGDVPPERYNIFHVSPQSAGK